MRTILRVAACLLVFSGLARGQQSSPPALPTNLYTTLPSGSGSPSSLSVDATLAKYGLKYNAHWVFDATTTTGANPTITCNNNNDCNFTSSDLLGRVNAKATQIVFAVCGPINFTNSVTATLDIAQTTITTINGAQSITVGGSASSACANNLVLVWGDDDTGTSTTGLIGFWSDVASICGRGLLPPGGILTQKGQFNKDGAASCANPATIGGNFEGVDLAGSGINTTLIIPTPNFDFTVGSGNSCSGHGATSAGAATLNVCFFGAAGMFVHDLQLWGGGNPLTGNNPASLTYLAGVSGGAASANASVWNVRAGSWGANAGANLRGFVFDNVAIDGAYQFVSDGLGNVACIFDGVAASPNFSTEVDMGAGSFCGDVVSASGSAAVLINNAVVTFHGGNYGFPTANGSIGVLVNGGRLYSYATMFEAANVAGNSTGIALQCTGATSLCVIDGAQINNGYQTNATAAQGIVLTSSATAYVAKTHMSGGTTGGSALNVCSGCLFWSQGGNIYSLANLNAPVSVAGATSQVHLEPTDTFDLQTSGTTPYATTNITCSSTGAGATATCAVFGTNESGWAAVTSAGAGPAAAGTLTLTFAGTFPTKQPANVATPPCSIMPVNGFGGGFSWNARATVFQNTFSRTAPTFVWDNNAVALVATNVAAWRYECQPR